MLYRSASLQGSVDPFQPSRNQVQFCQMESTSALPIMRFYAAVACGRFSLWLASTVEESGISSAVHFTDLAKLE